jgi:hypothetical protein
VVNVVTSFDMLNEEANAGSLAMNEWSACLRQLGVRGVLLFVDNILLFVISQYPVYTQQIQSVNTNSSLVDFCEEIDAKHIFVGDTAFSSAASEDSGIVLSIFNQAKRCSIGFGWQFPFSPSIFHFPFFIFGVCS